MAGRDRVVLEGVDLDARWTRESSDCYCEYSESKENKGLVGVTYDRKVDLPTPLSPRSRIGISGASASSTDLAMATKRLV